MKKIKLEHLLLIILFAVIQNQSLGQSTSGSPTYVSGNYLGWSSAGGPLPFQMGATQYMELTTAGFFGIGRHL